MICLEGTGALSHVSVRNQPDIFNEPCVFSAICVKGEENIARVLEGPLPSWKFFGRPGTGRGSRGKTYGLPRFAKAAFGYADGTFEISISDRSSADIPLSNTGQPFTYCILDKLSHAVYT